MSERCVAVTQRDAILTFRGCAADHDGGPPWTTRWARLTCRDWWVNPGVTAWASDAIRQTITPQQGPVFRHDPSFLVEFSDGRQMAGEMSPHFAQRRCAQWVEEGR